MLHVQKLDPRAKLPTVANPGSDLGYDLYSLLHVVLEPKSLTKVRTGIAVQFTDARMGGLLRDRSSMASKGITVSAGVIDAGFTGELLVLLTNTTDRSIQINADDKIAQMIPIVALTHQEVIEVKEVLQRDNRGAQGFGSSGR